MSLISGIEHKTVEKLLSCFPLPGECDEFSVSSMQNELRVLFNDSACFPWREPYRDHSTSLKCVNVLLAFMMSSLIGGALIKSLMVEASLKGKKKKKK